MAALARFRIHRPCRLALASSHRLSRSHPPANRAHTHVDDRIKEQVERVCRDVLAPLVLTDGGALEVLRFEGDDIYIHLSGACAGCPGAALTTDKIILPALRSVAPKIRVVVSTGVRTS
jgi:Fe-S cluster biogenesis protein NfuA